MGCLRLSYYETENESEKTEVSPLRMVWKNPKPGKIKKGKIFSFIGKKIQSSPETRSEKKETSIFSFIGKKEVTLKKYEKVNHLGNVQVVISDRKVAVVKPDKSFEYWKADVLSASDYYPFGMLMPGRNFKSDGYRFGFNGKEMINEIRGSPGTMYDYGFRIYSPGLGRFLSVDPLFLSYPWFTPYQFSGNNPILYIDLDGLEEANPQEISLTQTGKTQIQKVDAQTTQTTASNNTPIKNDVITSKAKWKTQSPNWGQCYKTTVDILKESGISSPGLKKNTVQMASESQDHTSISATKDFSKGIAEIDKALDKGDGVIVGVSHTYDYAKTKNSGNDVDGTTNTTDHFVVVY